MTTRVSPGRSLTTEHPDSRAKPRRVRSSGCQSLPRSTALGTIGLRSSCLCFRPPTPSAPARRRGEQASTKRALDQAGNVHINIECRPRQGVARRRYGYGAELRRRCALQARNDSPWNGHRPPAPECQFNGVSVRIVPDIHNCRRVLHPRSPARSRPRVALTTFARNISSHEASPTRVSAAPNFWPPGAPLD
jgi:hypothetical protein